MPLPLPDLDARRYDDLVAEMRALIPQLAPRWTDHNPSDPGITLIELLAWLAEATLYRLNQTPDVAYWNMIQLLRPEESQESPTWDALKKLTLPSARAQALHWFDEDYRAVTGEDFHELALNSVKGKISRVRVETNFFSGFVTVVIVPSPGQTPPEGIMLCSEVKDFLDQRRLVGTRVRVRLPIYTEVKVDIAVESIPDADRQRIGLDIRTQLAGYIDPITGGAEHSGWTFGRPVSIHDITPLIASVNGVKQVTRVRLDGDPGHIESAIKDLPLIKEMSVAVL